MLAIVEPDDLDEVLAICARWEVRATSSARSPPGRPATIAAAGCGSSTAGTARCWPTCRPRRCTRTPRSTTGRCVAAGRRSTRPPARWPARPLPAVRPTSAPTCSALLADTSWVWSQYDHQLFLNTVEGPGGDAAVLRLKHPTHRRRHRPGPGPHHRRQPPLVRGRPPAGHRAHRGRVGAQPGLRRRPPAGRRQLPQLRQPRAPRGDVAAVRGDRRHGRGLPGPRHPGRSAATSASTTSRRGADIDPDARSSACSAWSTGSSGARRASAWSRAAGSCSSASPSPSSSGSAWARAKGHRGGRLPALDLGRTTPRWPTSVRTLVAGGLVAGVARRGDRRPRPGPGRDGRALGRRLQRRPHRRPRRAVRRVAVPGRAVRRPRAAAARARDVLRRAPASRSPASAWPAATGSSVKGLLDVALAEATSTPGATACPTPSAPAPPRAEPRHRRAPSRQVAAIAATPAACWTASSRVPPVDVRVAMLDDDTPKEACGVFGVYAPGQPVAHLTYLGLYALQHRGPGVGGHGGQRRRRPITVVKDMGLVSNVFDDRTLAALTGHLAIGHTRYSTTGSSTWRNAQPVYRDVGAHTFALGHNGNLVNTEELAAEAGMLPGTVTSDSDLVAELIGRELGRSTPRRAHDGRALERALLEVLPTLEGAFSFVLMDEGHVDRRARPPRLPARCASASSTTAGCWPRRARRSTSSAPTSSARSSPARWSSSTPPATARCGRSPEEQVDPKLCLFEFVYFARPDSTPLRPERPPGPGAHGRAAGRAGAGRGRPGDGRARVGHPRGRGLRPRAAASPTARAW